MKEYVLGFLYDAAWIALIEKKRPLWQAGKLNGIGGSVEAGESVDTAMHREFKEEAGLDKLLWTPKIKLYSSTWAVYVYTCRDEQVQNARTMTDEEVVVCLLDNLHERNLCPHLSWLIPLVMDPQVHYPLFIKVESNYGEDVDRVG